ncbi:hypothetical protein WMY93_008840 [Mugilogobius chulae]|uniref:Uncharacterized protein n=1 Tax=Mugilogobius chulae TaxID=88201 RepID=A0AAW0PDC0_9GOBI
MLRKPHLSRDPCSRANPVLSLGSYSHARISVAATREETTKPHLAIAPSLVPILRRSQSNGNAPKTVSRARPPCSGSFSGPHPAATQPDNSSRFSARYLQSRILAASQPSSQPQFSHNLSRDLPARIC